VNLFRCVHEVRLLRTSGVAVGFFDSWDAALRAIENETSQCGGSIASKQFITRELDEVMVGSNRCRGQQRGGSYFVGSE
jgi:hypothetical protein